MPSKEMQIARSAKAAATAGSRPKERMCEGPNHACRFFRSSPYALISVDSEMKITVWNPAAEGIFGYSENEVVGRPLMRLVPERYKSTKNPRFNSFLETGKGPFAGKIVEVEGLRKDGTEVPIELSLLENDGGPHAATAIVRDISRLRQAETALLESEKKLQAVFEQSNDCMFFVDPETKRILYANPALPRLLGYDEDEVMEILRGDRHLTLYDFEHEKESIQRLFDKVLKKGRFRGERLYRRKDGYFVAMDVDATTKLMGRRKVISIVSRDATLRKKMEWERRKAEELQELAILSDQTCHDINNLITPIVNNTSVARMELGRVVDPAESARLVEMLNEVENAGWRAVELIRNLKEAAKATEHEKKPASIQLLMKTSAALASSYPGIKVDSRIPGGAWAVIADSSQICEVFDNLFTNAVHAIQGKEGIDGKITVSVENVDVARDNGLRLKEGMYVKISIQDNGIGIAEENLPSIFDLYFTTKPKGKGTGLGLAISKSIVTKHGGCITVESEEGHGTTFHVYLPASEEFDREKHITGDFEPLD